MNKSALVIQSFGRENEYRRAVLTILSFYAHSEASISETQVLLFTDHPEWFQNYLDGLPVTYILLSPEKVKAMRGENDFLHRMKIAAIEEAFQLTNANLLYADSDTFFTADPTELMNTLEDDRIYMHQKEYSFGFLGSSEQGADDATDSFKYKTFVRNDGLPIRVTGEMYSWNAGAMILHQRLKDIIPDVYALMDQLFLTTKSHASEQYAFSIILQKRGELQPCDHVIYHYWIPSKKTIVDSFLSMEWQRLEKQALFDRCSLARDWTGVLPGILENSMTVLKEAAMCALDENRFNEGFRLALKAIVKSPFSDLAFLRVVLYHARRRFLAPKSAARAT